jgi:iron complex transport system substrate-binding protein
MDEGFCVPDILGGEQAKLPVPEEVTMRAVVRPISLLLALVLAACAGTSPAGPSSRSTVPSPATSTATTASATPLTVLDDAGRTVSFPTSPKRIVSSAPSDTELADALGLGDEVVAVDKFSNYPPEAKSKPSIGSYIDPDLESIVGANPDLVLVTGVHLAKLVPALEARGISAVVLDAKNLEGVYQDLEILGRISGHEDRATAVVDQLRGRVAKVGQAVASATAVRTFVELDPTLFTVGPGSFLDDLIRRAGGINIAAGAATAYPQLSAEEVVKGNPEVIILTDEVTGVSAAAVKAREGWSKISAVVNGHIAQLERRSRRSAGYGPSVSRRVPRRETVDHRSRTVPPSAPSAGGRCGDRGRPGQECGPIDWLLGWGRG